MERLLVFLMLAFLAESFTEYIFGKLLKGDIIKYVSLAVGVLLSVAYQTDILTDYFGLVSIIPYFGIVLTGMILGRGANYLHDFARKYLGLDPSKLPGASSYSMTVNRSKPGSDCCDEAECIVCDETECIAEDAKLLVSLGG